MSSEDLQALPSAHVPLSDGAVSAACEGSLVLQLAEGHVALMPCGRCGGWGGGLREHRAWQPLSPFREESRAEACLRRAQDHQPFGGATWSGRLRSCGLPGEIQGTPLSAPPDPFVLSFPTLSPSSSSIPLLHQSVSRLPLFVFTQWLNKATVTVTEARSIEAQGLGLRGQRPSLGLGAAPESPLHTPISWSPPRGAGTQTG